jgi:hypothetical protein
LDVPDDTFPCCCCSGWCCATAGLMGRRAASAASASSPAERWVPRRRGNAPGTRHVIICNNCDEIDVPPNGNCLARTYNYDHRPQVPVPTLAGRHAGRHFTPASPAQPPHASRPAKAACLLQIPQRFDASVQVHMGVVAVCIFARCLLMRNRIGHARFDHARQCESGHGRSREHH